MRLSIEAPTDPGAYGFAHRIRVRFAETDAMGIVHHSRYLPYLEEARVAYLRDIGYPYHEIRAEGVDLTVLEAFVQYRMPLRFDDLIDVRVRLAAASRTTLQMVYLVTIGTTVHATGATVHGAVDALSGRPRRLPEWIHGLVRPFTD